jgi:Tfp pilus assembly protein PilF
VPLLAVVVLAVYLPTFQADFVRLDDFQYVVDNARVREPSWSGVVAFFSEVRRPTTVDGYYQPLTMLSLMLDAFISGVDATRLSPGIFHFTNIALHAATCALLYLLLRLIRINPWPAMLATLLYALHPTAVESVSWISQRKTVLATPLAIGALMAYLHYGRSLQRRWLWCSLVLYVLANLAKPTIVLLPLVLSLLDLWPLGRRPMRCLVEKWPFALVMAIQGWVAWTSQGATADGVGFADLSNPTMIARWISLLAYNASLYVGNVLWPMHLSPYRAIPGDLSLSNPAILGSLLLAIMIALFWLSTWRLSKPLFVGMASFVILISPALGPVRFMSSCVADRFLYFPLVFLVMPLSFLIQRMENRSHRGPFLTRLAIGGIVLCMLVLTHAQQRVWQDSKTLWTHIAESVPDFAKAHSNLALLALQEDEFDRALDHADRALKVAPEDGDSLHLRGRALTRLRRNSEAVESLTHALRVGLGPSTKSAHIALAEALAINGQIPEALKQCAMAIKLGANATAAYSGVADTAMRFGRRPDVAAEFYRESLKLSPDDTTVRWNLGTALAAEGRNAEALAEYEKVIAMLASQGRSTDKLAPVVDQLRDRLSVGAGSATSRPIEKGR